MKKITCILIAFIILFSLTVPAYAIEDISIEANAALLVDINTDTVLYSQNADQKAYPASLTKIMTALLLLEKGNLEDVVTASKTALSYDLSSAGSSANIKEGEEMTVYDLLCCVLIPSGNDACNVAAEYISGSIAEFVVLMNQRAQELGCTGTNFVNTHGLHKSDHYTTAADMYLITKEACKHQLFLEICNTSTKKLSATNKTPEGRYLTTTNYLISTIKTSEYIYHLARGIKTGYTSQAGRCLVSIAENNGLSLLSIVMGASTSTDGKIMSFVETKRLFEWGFDNYTTKTLLTTTENIYEVPVIMGLDKDYVTVKSSNSISAVVPKDFVVSEVERYINLTYPDGVTAPVEKGQVLGTMTLSFNGTEYGTVDLIASNSVNRSETLYYISELQNFISQPWVKYVALLVVALIIAYIVITIIVNSNKRKSSTSYRGSSRKRK